MSDTDTYKQGVAWKDFYDKYTYSVYLQGSGSNLLDINRKCGTSVTEAETML